MNVPIELPSARCPQAPQAVADAQWVDSPDRYAELGQEMSLNGWLGMDTEFVRERTFYPNPGLVQLSDGQRVWLIDVATLSDHAPMEALLADSSSYQVLHSVGEDLEIFQLLTGRCPERLFDTQLAAAMLGFGLQTRYEHLIELVFGDTLPGGQARSNWCQRPLSGALLSYAAQDVIYLPALAEVLADALDKHDRLAWLLEDCARLVAQKSNPATADPVTRVKGVGRLPREAMAYVDRLARWREEQAQARNLPRSFVLKDDILCAIGLMAHSAGVDQAVGAHRKPLGRWVDTCRDILRKTQPGQFEIPAPLVGLSTEQRQRLKEWQAKIATLADSLNVEPALIASKRELSRLLTGEQPDWMRGWRGPLVRDALQLPAKQCLGSSGDRAAAS